MYCELFNIRKSLIDGEISHGWGILVLLLCCRCSEHFGTQRFEMSVMQMLLRASNCHCNVKLCMSISYIKCVLKYLHKGCDQATNTYYKVLPTCYKPPVINLLSSPRASHINGDYRYLSTIFRASSPVQWVNVSTLLGLKYKWLRVFLTACTGHFPC